MGRENRNYGAYEDENPYSAYQNQSNLKTNSKNSQLNSKIVIQL